MQLLTILILISALFIQAKAKTSTHRKDYYLTAGTALQLRSPKQGQKKVIAFTISAGKGVILKKKYDFSLLLSYGNRLEQKFYGAGISSKYLLKILNKTSKINPYVAFFVGFNKGEYFNSTLGASIGNRFFVSPKMAMALNLEYAKTTSTLKEVTGLRSLISWSYFF